MANFDFLKGNIEIIILNALLTGDKYGYEISREIKDKTEQKYEIKQATLYSYLKRLESNGLIRNYWGEQSNGGRRKYFTLTDAGKTLCREYSAEWTFRKNILENLVVDEIADDTDTQTDRPTGRDIFLGTKTPRKRAIKSEAENRLIAEELKKLTQTTEEAKESIDTASSIQAPSTDAATAQDGRDELKIFQMFGEPAALNADFNFTESHRFDDFNSAENDSAAHAAELEKLFEQTEPSAPKELPLFSFQHDESTNDSVPFTPADALIDSHSDEIVPAEPNLQTNLIREDLTSLFDSQDELVKPKQKQEPLPRVPNTSPAFDAEMLARLRESTHANTTHRKKTESEKQISGQTSVNFKQFDREAESHQHYRSALNDLLSDQIADADAKIAQLAASRKVEQPRAADFEDGTIVDLAEKFAKSGIKVRFYNAVTSQYRAVPMLLKNKINFAVSWAAFVVFSALSWLFAIPSGNFGAVALAMLIFAFVPAAYTTIWRMRPCTQIKPKRNLRYKLVNRVIFFALTALFVVFYNLILFQPSFSDPAKTLYRLILPILALALLPISELIHAWFLKFKIFYN